MAEQTSGWKDMPARLAEPLKRCAAGLPANVALMQILMECADAGEAQHALTDAIALREKHGAMDEAARLRAVLYLLRDNPDAGPTVRAVINRFDHHRSNAAGDGIAYWAEAFSQAARENPEASVALYSLGNPQLLDAATSEIADRLADWGLISSDSSCLDIGCGIGRFEQALAGRVRRIVGIDIAPAMVEIARERCATLANVEIRQASGRDLADFSDKGFDLVLAVDLFPYLVASGAGLPGKILAECARVLRPSGHLVILNYSYRGELEWDRSDVRAIAAQTGLAVLRDGGSEFRLWDGAAFVLGSSAGP